MVPIINRSRQKKLQSSEDLLLVTKAPAASSRSGTRFLSLEEMLALTLDGSRWLTVFRDFVLPYDMAIASRSVYMAACSGQVASKAEVLSTVAAAHSTDNTNNNSATATASPTKRPRTARPQKSSLSVVAAAAAAAEALSAHSSEDTTESAIDQHSQSSAASSSSLLSLSSTTAVSSSTCSSSRQARTQSKAEPISWRLCRTLVYRHRKRSTIAEEDIFVCSCCSSQGSQATSTNCSSTLCENRAMHTECLEGHCPCGDLCQNMRFQKQQFAEVAVQDAGKKGKGMFAAEDIACGALIIEYTGDVISVEEMERRQKAVYQQHPHSYFLNLDSSEVIDATVRGNESRFLNHSCEPNAESQKWNVRGEIHVGFFALRDICAGEEIVFDYDFQRIGKARQQCFCGAKSCRGFIQPAPPKSQKKKKTRAELSLEKKAKEERAHAMAIAATNQYIRETTLSVWRSVSTTTVNTAAAAAADNGAVSAFRHATAFMSESVSEEGRRVPPVFLRRNLHAGYGLRQRQVKAVTEKVQAALEREARQGLNEFGMTTAETERMVRIMLAYERAMRKPRRESPVGGLCN